MEHNTNLTLDVSIMTVPMFRFFALPDYCFEELKIPQWAYDKRRSPLYVRPCVEVSSATVVPAALSRPGTKLSLPVGDTGEVIPPFAASDLGLPLGRTFGKHIAFSEPVEPSSVTETRAFALTQPTVRHACSATKPQYDFAAPVRRQTVALSADDGSRNRQEL